MDAVPFSPMRKPTVSTRVVGTDACSRTVQPFTVASAEILSGALNAPAPVSGRHAARSARRAKTAKQL